MLDYLRRRDPMTDNGRRRLKAGEEIVEPRFVGLFQARGVTAKDRWPDEVLATHPPISERLEARTP